jgi:hypothetical protein
MDGATVLAFAVTADGLMQSGACTGIPVRALFLLIIHF